MENDSLRYRPLNTSSTNSSNNEESEGASNLSRKLDDSIEKLDTLEDFASFKCYSPEEIATRVVTFNQIGLAYSLDHPVTAFFYAYKEAYEMTDGDTVGICPMQQVPFIKKELKDCESIDFECEDNISTKKAVFDLKSTADLPGKSGWYQFVYQNSLGDILGLSTAFQLFQDADSIHKDLFPQTSSPTTEGERRDKTQDEGFVVIPQPDAFYKDRCEHLSAANKMLGDLIRSMETQLVKKNTEIKELMSENELRKEELSSNKTLEQKCASLENEVAKYVRELNDMKQKLEEANDSREALRTSFYEQLEAQKKELARKDKLDLSRDEVQKILNDKQDEVNRLQALVTEYIVKNSSLKSKLDLSSNHLESVQTNLAAVLDERNRLTKLLETEKQNTAGMTIKMRELEESCLRYRKETVTIDAELRTTLANMKNVTRKYQEEREKGQRVELESDKMQVELAEMRTRMNSAREEYAKLWKMYQKAKEEKPTVTNSVDAPVEFYSILQKQPESSSRSVPDPAPVEQLIDIGDNLSQPGPSSQGINTEPKQRIPETGPSSSGNLGSPKAKKTVNMPCVMCDQMIACEQYADDTPRQMYEMVAHLEEIHLQRMCPVCSTMFDTRLPIFETYFNTHVQAHFKNDTRYPSLD